MTRLTWIPVMTIPLMTLTALLPGCAYWFFSAANPMPDKSRPVARIETLGGVEYGATTEYGILFLGRTATEGPCRVHYFLGPTRVVEDGAVVPTGGYSARAEMDLKNPSIPILDREVQAGDTLVAMYMAGLDVQTVSVSLAQDPAVEGDVLDWPGQPLPAGAAVLLDTPDGYRFIGLVSGEAVLQRDGDSKRFVLFAGSNQMRDMLLVPERYPTEERIVHRPDDIIVIK